MISLSDDGFVRLTLGSLMSLPLVHSVSGLDEEDAQVQPEEAAPTTVSGYTEWLGPGDHVVTLGWDWHLVVVNSGLRCVRVNQPRSNLMLVDVNSRDFGLQKTRMLLEAVIDSFSWQEEIMRFIATRYGG